jgi:hypothetical protein
MELCVRPSPLILTAPPVAIPSPRVGKEEWSPWPLTRPNLPPYTDETIVARARLGAIMRDMAELQRKHVAAAMDGQYLEALPSMYRRYQDWMNSLEYGLQYCEFASQQQLLLQ